MPKINYGIDLGTTNSAIAKWTGRGVVVAQNNDGRDTTPSAVYQGPDATFAVGETALAQVAGDADFVFRNFKLALGTTTRYRLRAGAQATAADLASRVLLALRSAAEIHFGEDVTEAVITIPAAATAEQREATLEAARLAHFDPEHVVFIPEPVAAAVAYGRAAALNDGYWLVYDLGGGTFDVALIRTEDGRPSMQGYAGDRYVGGQRIDQDIVQTLLVPALLAPDAQGCAPILPDFGPGNPTYAGAFAMLRAAAETAKISLSAPRAGTVAVQRACVVQDASGRPVTLATSIPPAAIEALARPLILQTVACVRGLLAEKNLTPSQINGILPVGGPTKMPYLRAVLTEELGIRVVPQGVDPMTVVATGAAILASGLDGKHEVRQANLAKGPLMPGTLRVRMEPDAGDSGTPSVDIMLEGDAGLLDGATLELETEGAVIGWASGVIAVPPSGRVEIEELPAEEFVSHRFRLIVRDRLRRRVPTAPAELAYTRIDDVAPTLLHSIGVRTENNGCKIFFAKGELLPGVHEHLFELTAALNRAAKGASFDLEFYEGEHKFADRNRRVGRVRIAASALNADLAAGSQMRIRLAIDRSQLMMATAVHTATTQEWRDVLRIGNVEIPRAEALDAAHAAVEEQLDTTVAWIGFIADEAEAAGDRRLVDEAEALRARLAAADIDARLSRARQARNAAPGDAVAAQTADQELREARAALDTLEDLLTAAWFAASCHRWIRECGALVEQPAQANLRPDYDWAADRARTALAVPYREQASLIAANRDLLAVYEASQPGDSATGAAGPHPAPSDPELRAI